MNKEDVMYAGLIILILSLVFVLGWFAHSIYSDMNTNNFEVRGRWLQNFNETQVYNDLYSKDSKGIWVAVNIKGLNITDALSICKHEIGHEIFARLCEKNMTKCLEEIDNIN